MKALQRFIRFLGLLALPVLILPLAIAKDGPEEREAAAVWLTGFVVIGGILCAFIL